MTGGKAMPKQSPSLVPKGADDSACRGLTRRGLIAGTAAAAGGILHQSSEAQSRGLILPPVEGAIRVAQIGLQGHYSYVVRGIPNVAACRLVAVAQSFSDENLDPLRSTPAWSSEVTPFSDYQRMLDEVRPNVVAIFAPYAHNGRVAIEAVRRGCHVISEKPLAGTLSELQQLRAARDKAGVRVSAILPMRQLAAFQAARKAVADGLIGEPVLISAQKSYQWGEKRPWFYRTAKDYGGSIPWVAIHAVDYIRYVTGLEFAEVTARQANKVHRNYPACADCGGLLFVMRNGGQATITFDFLRPAKAPTHGDDRLRVAGSEGVVEVRLEPQPWCELITKKDEPRQLPLQDSTPNPFVDFATSLRGLRSHYLTPDDPFIDTEVCLKARDSAEQNTTVKL